MANMEMNDSKFNMWRACMAVMHLDGHLDPQEKEWGTERIKFLKNLFKLSDDRVALLTKDMLEGGVDLVDLISKITDKKDRGFLVHQIRTIGYLDQDFGPEEKEAFEAMKELVLSNLDLDAIARAADAVEMESYHESEVYKVHNKHSKYEKAFTNLLKVLNPGDYKFPKQG